MLPMNTAQACLDLLIPNIETRTSGQVSITSPLPTGQKVSLRATINDLDGHRSVILEQFLDRSADAPRAVRLRNPEAYGPLTQVRWGFCWPMGSMADLHVFAYENATLGVNWSQPMAEAEPFLQEDARYKLFSYLRNLIRQDYAEG